jgi:hypothetical protein
MFIINWFHRFFTKKAKIAAIEIIPHSRGPCRYCGCSFEQQNGGFGCGCSGLSNCPNCGCPVKQPLNRG